MAEGSGDVEVEDGVLTLKRIAVTYRLAGVAEDQRKTVERVHALHKDRCPVARSIAPAIDVTTTLEYV